MIKAGARGQIDSRSSIPNLTATPARIPLAGDGGGVEIRAAVPPSCRLSRLREHDLYAVVLGLRQRRQRRRPPRGPQADDGRGPPPTGSRRRKSFEKLKPDMLIVLGDISARGSELTETKWLPILQQFHSILGPFESLPYLVVLGDRDVGECSKLDWRLVSWISSNFPGLDSAGCTDFEINNISFVSLNVVAMLCGKNELRFDVEKVIERESLGLRSVVKDPSEGLDKMSSSSSNSWWRDNDAAPSSGPVLLLHFPLHCCQTRNFGADVVMEEDVCGNPCCGSNDLGDSGIVNAEPYRLMQTLTPNVTGYIFQSLKPRMVFSGHTHNFCDHKHVDGTREVTVPAMTFSTEGNPGFVIVTFRKDRMVRVCHCSLARESLVILVYAFTVVMLIIATICMIKGIVFDTLNWRLNSQH